MGKFGKVKQFNSPKNTISKSPFAKLKKNTPKSLPHKKFNKNKSFSPKQNRSFQNGKTFNKNKKQKGKEVPKEESEDDLDSLIDNEAEDGSDEIDMESNEFDMDESEDEQLKKPANKFKLKQEEEEDDEDDDDEDFDFDEDEESEEDVKQKIVNGKQENKQKLIPKQKQIKNAKNINDKKQQIDKKEVGGKKRKINDEEQEDDDDEDEDFDEDEDEESEEDVKPQIVNGKQENKQKLMPKQKQNKNAQNINDKKQQIDKKEVAGIKRKNNDTQTANKLQKTSDKPKIQNTSDITDDSNLSQNLVKLQQQRLDKKNACSIFVKGFSHVDKIETDDLLSLHPDIKFVQYRKRERHAYLVFDTEQACDKALKQMTGKQLKGKDLQFDFCGPKSAKYTLTDKKKLPNNFSNKNLYVTGFGRTVNEEAFKRLFPSSSSVTMIKFDPRAKGSFGFAFVDFPNKEIAEKAFMEAHEKELGGIKCYVTYALKKRKFAEGELTPKEKLQLKKLKKKEKKKAKDMTQEDEPSPQSNGKVDKLQKIGAQKIKKDKAPQMATPKKSKDLHSNLLTAASKQPQGNDNHKKQKIMEKKTPTNITADDDDDELGEEMDDDEESDDFEGDDDDDELEEGMDDDDDDEEDDDDDEDFDLDDDEDDD